MTTLSPRFVHSDYHASGVAEIAGYRVVGNLGRGAASDLYLVTDEAGQRLALKHVRLTDKKSQRFLDQAVSEHQIAQQFNDPRIRQSHRLVKIRSGLGRVREVAVVMEYVHGKTLEALTDAPLEALCSVFFEAASALHVMHQGGFVHADLKPSNLMVCRDKPARRDRVKIIDLGQSCPTGTVKQRIQGTPDYIAPEQVNRRTVDARTDVYCFGATMYKLVTGQKASHALPSKPQIGQYAVDNAMQGSLLPAVEINPRVPLAMSNLLADCLAHNPQDRPPGMQAVRDRLEFAIQQCRRWRRKAS